MKCPFFTCSCTSSQVPWHRGSVWESVINLELKANSLWRWCEWFQLLRSDLKRWASPQILFFPLFFSRVPLQIKQIGCKISTRGMPQGSSRAEGKQNMARAGPGLWEGQKVQGCSCIIFRYFWVGFFYPLQFLFCLRVLKQLLFCVCGWYFRFCGSYVFKKGS